MKTTFVRLFASCAVCAVVLPAQASPDARAFLPDDYRNGAFVDLAAMRQKGIWDELEVSVLKLVFARMEKESGYSLRAIDRAMVVALPGEGEAMASRSRQVHVLEGNLPLGTPESVRQLWPETEVGGKPVRQQRGDGGDLYFCPRPEVVVYGSESILRPVLEGRPNQGLPAPDVMSLLSGRNGSLAWMVVHTGRPELRERVLGRLFAGVTWPDGDAPDHLCLRLLATGDADDPHLGLELVLRHARAADGLDVSARAMVATLARLAAMPQLRAQKVLLQRAQSRRDHADLVYSLDLGRVRDAVGHVAAIGALFLVAEAAPTVQAAPAIPAPPAPAGQPKK